ncbi:tryptophan dimethylallyltransferase-domain-containing protein [Aspergillus leporis]|uniref:Tryptophan dimethylallyltransferase-domain-containing protein n=1 Tax=Aspergillus leporis TaxID=41062 RepID=A0A5N5WZP1_9EURO|nr:tryptophan dimethylallyltransferase-domain-containing protein [Aspergillus leporis]
MTQTRVVKQQQSPTRSQSTQAWRALAQYLPPLDSDSNFWWQLSGRHLAALVEAAGYPIEKQYEALLFHYHWTVRYMGQAPRADSAPIRWKSLIALDGTPIEYSWKWNTRTSEPDVRYVTEPIGRSPGTELDPLNQQGLRELLQGLAAQIPSVDLTWVNHFLATLYDHDHSKYMQEATSGAHLGTSIQFAAELLPKGVTLKTYFFPRKLGQNGLMPVKQWEEAINQLDPDNAARAALHAFMTESPEGQLLTPFSLGVDDVVPMQSRLKWYFHTPNTIFASVRDVMTLGGRINPSYMATALNDLFSLIRAVTGVPDDFDEHTELPAAPSWDSSRKAKFGDLAKMLSGYLYYFDIAPGNSFPEIKIFIPVRYYAHDDLKLARGLTGWMEAHGRGAYCQRYLRMLDCLSEHRHLQDSNGLQTFVSCLIKKDGELDITTYLGAEAFHPARLGPPRRATRRREDW